LLHWFEHSQVYHPERILDATGAELGRPFEEVRFTAIDGVALHGWFYPVAINSPRRPLAVLVCHGNGGNISHRLALYEALLETGVNVFAFDYRGYGRSGGLPSEPGTYLDAEAACHWLELKGFDTENVIAFGESLGGGVVSELALRVPLGGVVLQSTFTSIPEIGAHLFPWLPVRWLASIHYNTHSKLPRLHVPVLVLHSRMDGLVPFRHSEKNFAAANQPKLFWEIRGGHNDLLDERAHFVAGMERFLRMVEDFQRAMGARGRGR
jgi:uncharacterized protein